MPEIQTGLTQFTPPMETWPTAIVQGCFASEVLVALVEEPYELCKASVKDAWSRQEDAYLGFKTNLTEYHEYPIVAVRPFIHPRELEDLDYSKAGWTIGRPTLVYVRLGEGLCRICNPEDK